MAELRGTGIHFGQPTYNQNGSETNDNTYQGRAPAIVKVGYGSADDTDQNVTGSSGATGVITGTEVNMGVPQASDNLYRINFLSPLSLALEYSYNQQMDHRYTLVERSFSSFINLITISDIL